MRAAVLALFLLGCPAPAPPPPVDPSDVPTCSTACSRMRALGCDAGQPTPRGEPCEAVCVNLVESGIVNWRLDCMSHATSCKEVDRCNP